MIEAKEPLPQGVTEEPVDEDAGGLSPGIIVAIVIAVLMFIIPVLIYLVLK